MDGIDNGLDVAVRFPTLQGGGDGPTVLVTEYHDESNAEMLDGVLDAAQDLVVDDIARVTHHEQIAQALIEEKFRRNARIGATEDYGKRMLPGRGKFMAPLHLHIRVALPVLHMPPVAFHQPRQRLVRSDGFRPMVSGSVLSNGSRREQSKRDDQLQHDTASIIGQNCLVWDRTVQWFCMNALGGVVLVAALAAAQEPQEFQIVKVVGGFQSADGPLWHPEGYLLATDPPAGKIRRLKPGVVPEVALQLNAAGIAFDHRKRLIICDPVKRQVLRWDGKGQPDVLAAQFEGKKLNSPNDVITRGNQIFFTDPAFGSASDTKELGFHGVYRLTEKGELTALAKWEKRPNGIALSPNGRILYVTASDERAIRAYDLDRGGAATNERLVVTGIRGAPNGIAVDESGNLYVACAGVAIYTPEGKESRFIEMGDPPTNVAFGDGDFKALYVTARSGVYRIRVQIRGAGAPE